MSSCLCMNKGNGTKGKRLDFLRVIMLIGSVPLLSAIIILTICAAMKMENEICAPQDGTVATVECSVGDSVETGKVLVSMN